VSKSFLCFIIFPGSVFSLEKERAGWRVNWLSSPPEIQIFSENLRTIAHDFLLGGENSLGRQKPRIEEAVPE
jgi:hypothetical protein